MATKRSAGEDHETASRNAKRAKSKSSAELNEAPAGTSKKKLGRSDYTVGWICAITTEYVAARAFLDATHAPQDTSLQNDNNNYTLGEIAGHNVVIAVLPKRGYGTTSAANVARDMLRTFPNIRIGLMVGIAGGAPTSTNDIRLGDIVVSTPHNREGGVFQYDFGKAIQDQEFQITGHLNQPPLILEAAVSGLEADYELNGHGLEDAIDRAIESNPRLRRNYRRPDPGTDKLYLSQVTHPVGDKRRCIDVCGDDPSKLVQRDPRTEDDDNPAIHYGIVASADRLMKDAVTRDKFANENGVLCFEMEAAGFMNHFPCLVIRGICDYSDTHKNDQWQGYAAMVAAAYAKDLLSRIPAHRLQAERRISDILSSVERNVQEARRHVKDLVSEQRHAELYRWLSPPDPSSNYNKALQQRHKGTGTWFLQSHSFSAWKSQKVSLMWLYGIPGCGKTVLSSTIIEHLQSISIKHLLYFYFDFSDTEKQTLRGLVCSLVYQLYHACKSAQKPLDGLLSSCQNSQPSCESLCNVLRVMIKRAEEVYIVLDAIDECSERKGGPAKGLLSWLRGLMQANDNLCCLVTSRPEQDIQAEMNSLTGEENRVSIQNDLVRDDILAYIDASVRNGERLERWRGRPDVQEEIEEKLSQKAAGMFRWVACQIDALEDCLDYPSLSHALDSLPETLDDTYARMIEAIPAIRKPTALRLLQFLTFSYRRLTIEEAIDAIAVNTDKPPHFSIKDRMPNPEEIARYCSSLVIIVPVQRLSRSTKCLQLAHFSVKEYLTSTRLACSIAPSLQEKAAGATIARVCLEYLLHFDQVPLLREIRQNFPFAEYAAVSWMHHARVAGCKENQLLGFIERLFCHQLSAYQAWYNVYHGSDYYFGGMAWEQRTPCSPLYQAAFGGLLEVIELLLEKGADVNAMDEYWGTALHPAALEGHEAIVKFLIDRGADVNARGGPYGTALVGAALGGHEAIVKLLLDNNADGNVPSPDFGPAIYVASLEGSAATVKLLIDHNVDVNPQFTGLSPSPLGIALEHRHDAVAKLLRAAGAVSDRRTA